MEEELDFFFNNNASQTKKRKYETKKIKPYNATRIKSQNFLTNILYNGMKEEDLFDRYFVFNVSVLAAKNINSFSLERKIFDVKNREMIHMFWEDCNETSFYKHICKSSSIKMSSILAWLTLCGNILKKMMKTLINLRKSSWKKEITSVCLFQCLPWGLQLWQEMRPPAQE